MLGADLPGSFDNVFTALWNFRGFGTDGYDEHGRDADAFDKVLLGLDDLEGAA